MKKELLYLCACLLLFFVLLQFPVDLNTVLLDATLDINMHDTYFVIDPNYVIISHFIFSFAFVYFLRVLFTKFQNKIANYLYLVFNGLFILLIVQNIIAVYRIEIVDTVSADYNNLALNELLHTNRMFYIFIGCAVIAVIFEIYTIFRLREH